MSQTITMEQRVNAQSLVTQGDRAALHDLITSGMPEDQIVAWSQLGRMVDIRQLDAANFPFAIARQFPRTPDLLKNIAASLPSVRNNGMDFEDLMHWYTAGVYILKKPYYNPKLWHAWRSAGVKNLGLHRAAVAAAAGITASEAALMMKNGTWDDETAKIMAALRSPSR